MNPFYDQLRIFRLDQWKKSFPGGNTSKHAAEKLFYYWSEPRNGLARRTPLSVKKLLKKQLFTRKNTHICRLFEFLGTLLPYRFSTEVDTSRPANGWCVVHFITRDTYKHKHKYPRPHNTYTILYKRWIRKRRNPFPFGCHVCQRIPWLSLFWA